MTNIYGVIKITCPEGYATVLRTQYAYPENVIEWGDYDYLRSKYGIQDAKTKLPEGRGIYRTEVHVAQNDEWRMGDEAAVFCWRNLQQKKRVYFFHHNTTYSGKYLAGWINPSGEVWQLRRSAEGRDIFFQIGKVE
jgi:hypothetical protein